MSEPFQYDVFLSHSAKDKKVVRDVAERLRKDGLQTVTQLSTSQRLGLGAVRFPHVPHTSRLDELVYGRLLRFERSYEARELGIDPD